MRDARAAAQFSVEPLKLTLDARKLATSLTLGNTGAGPVTVQAELLAWDQDGGDDAYAEAAGLVVSPPIFRLAPGASQVVRVGRLKRGTPPAREQAYRIKLTEVPPDASEKARAVATFMQISLPIFVPPADPKARPAVEVAATARPDGALALAVSNAGLVHDKLTRLVLTQDGRPLAERALNFYVLAGARRELVWPGVLRNAGAAGGPLELRIQLDGRTRSITRPVAPAPPVPVPEPPAPMPAPEASSED